MKPCQNLQGNELTLRQVCLFVSGRKGKKKERENPDNSQPLAPHSRIQVLIEFQVNFVNSGVVKTE